MMPCDMPQAIAASLSARCSRTRSGPVRATASRSSGPASAIAGDQLSLTNDGSSAAGEVTDKT